MSENNLTVAFLSNAGHIYFSYEATSAINPFKQPKHAFKLKLPNFKISANCKIFICLPDYNINDLLPKLLGI